MIHSLTIQLSEEAFSMLQRQAVAARTSPAELAAVSLERLCEARRPVPSDAERDAARQRFERHFGEVDLGYPTGAENEGIDADLVAEYADTHEAG
jgi:hypothetical protein